MTTAELIISRLPARPIVTPQDLAAAVGMSTTVGVVNAIQSGKIDAVKIGGRYYIGRDAAAAYVRRAAKEAAK